MDIAGYAASVFIGIALGLIGGGGSILTVPVLVYLFNIDAVWATTYSLFIVGTTSAVGSVSYFRKGLIDIRTAIVFGIPSIAAVFISRDYIVPSIPQQILTVGNFTVTRNIFLLLLFAITMIFASWAMIGKEQKKADEALPQRPVGYSLIFLHGIFTGLITGLIGAGGGFLIIPALVNMLKIPMKTAVGTSLLIIAINSLVGFLFSLNRTFIQWQLLLSIASIAIAGVLIGNYFSAKIDGKKLKPVFGWFVLAMGVCIVIKETLLK